MRAIAAIDDDSVDLKWLERCHQKSKIPNPLVLFQDPDELVNYAAVGEAGVLPGVILIDIRMPTSGFEIVQRLQERGCTAKLYLFSTSTHPADVARAKKLDTVIIQKPADRDRAIALLLELSKEIERYAQ